jgi:hypothetical protein
MHYTPPRLQNFGSDHCGFYPAKYGEDRLLSCEIGRHSERTFGNRRMVLEKLLWYFNKRAV